MIDRLNRLLLLLLGLALLAAGLTGLAAREDLIPLRQPGDLYRTVMGAQPSWVLPAITIAVLLVLVLLAARLLIAQLRSENRPSVDSVVLQQTDRGATRMDGSALADAVAQACSGLDGVTDASASLVDPDRPTLLVRLALATEARSDHVAHQMGEVLQQARRSVGSDVLTADVRVRHTNTPPPRIR